MEAGLAPNTLGRIESPDWQPSLETLRRLEALLPPDWMPPEPPTGEASADAMATRPG